MQKSLQLFFLVAFLFITMRTQASVAPKDISPVKHSAMEIAQKSADELWPSIETYVRQDPRFTQREMLSLNKNQLEKYFEIISEILPKNETQTDLLSGEDHIPQDLIAAGFHLRELRKITELRPEFSRAVFDYLLDCSQEKRLNSTMSTVCLGHALQLSKKVDVEVELENYSEKMVELAQLTL